MKGPTLIVPLLALTCLLAVPVTSAAQEDTGELRRNSIGLKLGGHYEDSENDPLYGLEYTRWLDEDFGVSVSYDYVDTDMLSREQALAVTADIKFARRWIFFLGPGLEFIDDDRPGAPDDSDEFFFRLGLAVEFELGQGGWFIAPLGEADLFRNEQKYVLGAVFGKRF